MSTAADGPAPTAGTGERAVPYHCPYCAEEDLRPLGPTPGAWHCRACTRTFSVKYLGIQPLDSAWPPTTGSAPHAIPTGGSR
jgi:ribosomal protein L37AE/L43A